MNNYQKNTVTYPQCPFDTVMLTEKSVPGNKEKCILELLQQGKRVENFQELEPEQLYRLECKENFTNYLTTVEPELSCTTQTLFEIPVPVFFVLSLYEDLDKFAVQLALRKILRENSIAVSQIGTRPYCERFGFHSFTQFMYKDTYTPEEKIFCLNRYIFDMVKREKSEAVIIGIPGAYNKFNSSYPMGFGILPYLVSQAVTPDFSVMCTFYAELEKETFFKQLSENCKGRLGFEIDCFHMSGTYIDMLLMKETGDLKYTHMSDEAIAKLIQSKYANFESCIFNVYTANGEKTLSDKLFAALSPAYEEVEVLW